MTQPSPRLTAGAAGVLYLVTIVLGASALSVRSGLIVHGDAAATAAHILASEPFYRAAVLAELIGTVAYVGVTALLYELLAPVSRAISRLAAFFSLAGCAIGSVASVGLLAPLVFLSGAPFLAAFRPEQLQALAYASLRIQGQAYDIGMLYFGFYCLTLGYLTYRSALFPRAVGVLVGIAGAGWLAATSSSFLSPPLGNVVADYTLVTGFLGEGALALWLLVLGMRGTREQRPADRPMQAAAT